MLDQTLKQKPAQAVSSSLAVKRGFTYVYLCSCPRSGSTLVANLLARHPEVSTVGEFGETFFGKTGLCTCGAQLQNCELWTKWAERAKAEGLEFEIGSLPVSLINRVHKSYWEDLFYHLFPFKFVNKARDLLYLPTSYYIRHARKTIAYSIRLAQILCDIDGTSFFLDTSKGASQVRFLSKYGDIPLKVVALVRDGRATMCSLMGKLKKSKEEAVRDWMWWNNGIERAITHYANPSDVYRLRLEDLCWRPAETMGDLCRFIGIDPKALLDFSSDKKCHVLGNPTRHQFNGELRLDESWKKKLTREELNYFEALAGKLNRRYGYEP
jgi:Sulfotransferase domain